MIEEVQRRAAMRGMNPMEYLRWRNTLRQDYQQAFDPPTYKPATHLPFGHANHRLLAELIEVTPPGDGTGVTLVEPVIG